MLRSHIQREVIKLYKGFLHASSGTDGMKEYIRQVFRQNAQLKRTEMLKIEYLLHKGQRELRSLKQSGNVTRISKFK